VLYALQQSCAVIESVFVSQTLNYDDTQKTLAQLTKWLQEPTKDIAAFQPTNVKIVSHEMNMAGHNDQASFYRIKALLQLALKRVVV
jgi:HPt (histidine-containing phosphotransfer) domain-containing protein